MSALAVLTIKILHVFATTAEDFSRYPSAVPCMRSRRQAVIEW